MPRTIAIGDIHGCSTALAKLIKLIAPQPDDVILPLGDFVDRGIDSKGVMEQLIALGDRCHLSPDPGQSRRNDVGSKGRLVGPPLLDQLRRPFLLGFLRLNRTDRLDPSQPLCVPGIVPNVLRDRAAPSSNISGREVHCGRVIRSRSPTQLVQMFLAVVEDGFRLRFLQLSPGRNGQPRSRDRKPTWVAASARGRFPRGPNSPRSWPEPLRSLALLPLPVACDPGTSEPPVEPTGTDRHP